jgi:hypothetical protein
VVSHVAPHAVQFCVVVMGVSHPSVSGGAVLQSAQPVSQPEYTHVGVEPEVLQLSPWLCVVSHVSPHAPQLLALVGVSQPSRSGAALLQSAYPGAQPAYLHVVPSQEAPVLWVVSHCRLHPVQLLGVSVGVSQPFVSGAVLSQSAQPVAHPAYVQLSPTQLSPVLWSVSHAFPQPAQFEVVVVGVSQPSVFGAVLLQSAKPVSQPVYVHVVPLQPAPWLCFVSHAAPQAVQLVTVVIFVSQPSVSGAAASQSP